jgi:hypothetical protein
VYGCELKWFVDLLKPNYPERKRKDTVVVRVSVCVGGFVATDFVPLYVSILSTQFPCNMAQNFGINI